MYCIYGCLPIYERILVNAVTQTYMYWYTRYKGQDRVLYYYILVHWKTHASFFRGLKGKWIRTGTYGILTREAAYINSSLLAMQKKNTIFFFLPKESFSSFLKQICSGITLLRFKSTKLPMKLEWKKKKTFKDEKEEKSE